MKRLFLLTLSLLAMSGIAFAQNSHWSYQQGQQADEMFVYAEFVLGSETVYDLSTYSNYEFAAYVGDDVRAVLDGSSDLIRNTSIETTEAYMLRFRIEGDRTADAEKMVTFKVWNKISQLEYNLNEIEYGRLFTGNTDDIPSNPARLMLTEPTSLSLSDIKLNVGQTASLSDYVTSLPEGADIPNNLVFSAANEGFVTIDGSAITGVKPIASGVTIIMTYGKDVDGGNKQTYAHAYVYQPASGIEQLQQEVTVPVGEIIHNLTFSWYKLNPENSTDEVVWSSDNESVVGFGEKMVYMALAPGDAVLTGRVYSHDGTLRETIPAITVTVHVTQPVTSITTPFYVTSETDYNYLDCLSGDDLTSYFADGLAFNVLPATATDKRVTFEYAVPNLDHCVDITADGRIVALQKFSTEPIKVTSVSNPEVSCIVWVMVHNDYTAITATEPATYNYTYRGESIDVSQVFDAAFVMGPDGRDTFYGGNDFNNMITISNPDVLQITANGAYIVSAGQTTVTMSFKWKDYLKAEFDETKSYETVVSASFVVNVTQGVESITSPFSSSAGVDIIPYLECSVGDDLTSSFVDGKAFTVNPSNAVNKEVTIALSGQGTAGVVSIAGGVIEAVAEGETIIEVVSKDNAAARCLVYVRVHNDVKDVVFAQSSISQMMLNEAVDISSKVQNNISFLPADASAFYNYNVEVTSSNDNVVSIGDVFTDFVEGPRVSLMANAVGIGTAQITVSFQVKDYLTSSFDPVEEHVSTVSKTFTVIVSQGLSGFEISGIDGMVAGETYQITITPQPYGSVIDDLSKLSIEGHYANNTTWPAVTVLGGFTEGSENTVKVQIKTVAPGDVEFTVNYDNGAVSSTPEPVEVGYRYNMTDGWAWQTIPYGYPEQQPAIENANGLFTVFGDDVVEIRTQGEQLYNDPEYGYFGDLDLLSQNVCFKVNMYNSRSYDFFGGSLGNVPGISMRQGWNWLPNPYFFNRSLSNIFGANTTFEAGDRIVSKTGGFAEYDGQQWLGDLEVLKSGEGYLYYNAAAAGREMTFNSEMNMAPADDQVSGGSGNGGSNGSRAFRAGRRGFSYDASRFRDNMTIVAQVEGISEGKVIAFVGDECRGEGQNIDGRVFVTVHANAGETISFKVYDAETDMLFDIDQTVRMQMMLGTLKAPFRMTSADVATGISSVGYELKTANSYDLGGRALKHGSKGLQLQKQADGTVKKVVLK